MSNFYIKHFRWIFLIITVIELSGVLWMPQVRFISKPAIMVSLIAYYYLSAEKIDWAFLIALVFALGGDSFLMFEGFFIFGLSSFLLMQFLYGYCFTRQRGGQSNLKLFLSLIVLALSVSSTVYLFPYAGEMAIPVVIYSVVILFMVLAGIWRKNNGEHYQWILFGVISFLISDGILAINKFANPFESAGFLVMLTYIIAQYLIVNGYLKYQKQESQVRQQ